MRRHLCAVAVGAAILVGAFVELTACSGSVEEEHEDAAVTGLDAASRSDANDATPSVDATPSADATGPTPDAGPPIPTAGLALWLASDVGVTAAYRVTRWADQSGHGRDATGGANEGPLPVKVWPGRPGTTVLGFEGQQTPVDKWGPYLDVDLGWLASLDGFTVFVVVAGGPGYANPWCAILAAGRGYFPPACCGDDGRTLTIGMGTPSPFVDGGRGSAFVDRTCGVASMSLVGAQDDARLIRAAYSPKTGLYTLRQNGGPPVDDGAQSCSPVANRADLDGGGGWIGHAPQTYGEYHGLLAEVVGYERELSAAEALVVESYLRAKWGTP